MDPDDSFDSNILEHVVSTLPNQQSGGSSNAPNGGLYMSTSPVIGSNGTAGRYVQMPATPPYMRGASSLSPAAPGGNGVSAASATTVVGVSAPASIYPAGMALLYASTPMTSHGMANSDTASSDISNSSTNHGYDTFPPSPTSWIEDMEPANGNAVHY